MLRGRKVLVVDDDARNIFALTTVLENHEMDVVSATNGRQAIEIIQQQPDLSVVLMDIMMPDMDGYETMREIRKDPRFRTLPILALTAKAMKGDREKCLEAGASDYIAKPVNTDQLLSLLRVWLYRSQRKTHHPKGSGEKGPGEKGGGNPPSCWWTTRRETSRCWKPFSQSPDYRLVRAQTADDALLALVQGEFACIVLDIQMPGMSGIELARLIKTRKRNQHIPIIFLTAYFQEDKDVLQGLRWRGRGGLSHQAHQPANPQIQGGRVRGTVPHHACAGRRQQRPASNAPPNWLKSIWNLRARFGNAANWSAGSEHQRTGTATHRTGLA